jgi:hypothetical protein
MRKVRHLYMSDRHLYMVLIFFRKYPTFKLKLENNPNNIIIRLKIFNFHC